MTQESPPTKDVSSPPLAGQIVIVSGAASQIGRFLLPRLADAGALPVATSRNPLPGDGRIAVDFSRPDTFPVDTGATGLIHLGPLWLLPDVMARAVEGGIRRIVAFGSTSMKVKDDSTSAAERQVVRKLADAERKVADEGKRLAIRWTIFRPTLVYGAGIDNNVAAIGRVVRRFGFFPLAGSGKGMRQPVHADDLAAACVAAYPRTATFDTTYDLVGGERLTYREMVAAVFATLEKRERIVSLPRRPLRMGLRLLSLFPGYRHVTPDMADRMERDLIFDATKATNDFGYAPRPFRPLPPEALLPSVTS